MAANKPRDSSQVGVSLEAIRNEVKAALSKVSSSVDLVATAGINHNNLKGNNSNSRAQAAAGPLVAAGPR